MRSAIGLTKGLCLLALAAGSTSLAAPPGAEGIIQTRLTPQAVIDALNARVDTSRLGSDHELPLDGEPVGAWSTEVASIRYAAGDGGGCDVAIVAAATSDIANPRFTDPQAKILAQPGIASCAPINASAVTPTLGDLMAFDAIITWSNVDYADSVAFGDVCADYVDAGGGVVVATFANTATVNRSLQGRWITGGYEIIVAGGGQTQGTQATLGTVLDPGHPTMENVATFDGGTTSFRPTDATITASSTKIAEWSDGKTLVAVGASPQRADLGFYPPSDVVSASWWVSTTDGGAMLANALKYVGCQSTVVAKCHPFGNDESAFTNPDRFRGNQYTFNGNNTISEFQVELGFTGAATLYFYVLEADDSAGPYNVIAENVVNAFGTGQAFYNSGSMSAAVTTGKFYGIGAFWGATPVTYYRQEGVALRTWQKGEVLGIFASNGVQPPIAGPFTPGFLGEAAEYSMDICFASEHQFHLSARVIDAAQPSMRLNQVFLADDTGTITGQYDEIAGAIDDAWGYRDGAYDDNGGVYFGWAGGLARHECDGGNGTLACMNNTGNTTIRALAYDPRDGSVWTADFGSDLVNYDPATCTVIATFTNTSLWSLYGLAWNDADNTLWGHNTGGEVIKIDPATGTTIPGGWPSAFPALAAQGGLSAYPDLSGQVAAISQGTPDEMGVYDSSTGLFTLGPIDIEAQSGTNGHLGVAVAACNRGPCGQCEGDLNNDGVVNVFDLLIVLANWGTPSDPCADPNGDGVVNVFDLLIVLGAWGPCPPTAAVIWDEAIDGDLSGDRMAPTPIALGPGMNMIIGNVGLADDDYFVITMPAGMSLQQIVVDNYAPAGNTTFLGVNTGPIYDPTPNNLVLGFAFFGIPEIGMDILPAMGALNGNFVPPLPNDQYSFWCDEGTGPQDYAITLLVGP